MALILNLETSTNVCSVSVSKDGETVFYIEDRNGPSHASLLGLFVQKAVDEMDLITNKPDAIAVSKGPGSYTGLRIGVSESKGLCYGWDIPLIALDTLEVLTESVFQKKDWEPSFLFCPMLDARRMEVYTCLMDKTFARIKEIEAIVVDNTFLQHELSSHQIVFFGNGSDKCKGVIQSSNSIFIPDIYPSAKSMSKLAEKRFNEQKFENIAYFEPFYLKDFVSTASKKKLF